MKTFIMLTRTRPQNQDAEWFQIIRHRNVDGEEPISEYLGHDGEWHEFNGYDTIFSPFCVLDGIQQARALGTGLRSAGWSMSWEVQGE